jgi:hypothetical protein
MLSRKIALASLSISAFIFTAALTLDAGTLSGVTLPDNVQVAGKALVLNGMGIRTKFMVKVYIAGLYLEQKSSDASAIIKADAPKQIIMKFVHGASKSQMSDAFEEGFKDNSPDAAKTLKPDIDRLLAALQPINVGDQMVFTYLPGTGTTMAINGQDKLSIAGPAFGQLMMSVWFGPKPPNADLKKGLLGQ